MKFQDWTAKAVEVRVLEMADTLRKSPAVKDATGGGGAMVNQIGVPVVVGSRGAPFIVSGVSVPPGGFVFAVRIRDGVNQYAVSPSRNGTYATQGAF